MSMRKPGQYSTFLHFEPPDATPQAPQDQHNSATRRIGDFLPGRKARPRKPPCLAEALPPMNGQCC